MGNSISSAIISDPRKFSTEVPSDGSKDGANEYRKYDYVIVGGGAAGCVLASRLSEDRNVTVLLVEAGTSHGSNLFSPIPFAFTKTFHSEIDWAFKTTPQRAMHDRQIDHFRGKTLGGTTAINASIYHHCAPQDFDQWASLGLSGWSYNDLHPYFIKAEGYHPSSDYPGIKSVDRGADGPWITGHSTSPLAPVCQAAFKACLNLGVPELADVNTPQGTSGVVDFIGNIDPNGRRVSTATAYLTNEVLARPNLTVAVKSHVDKILFDRSGESPPRAVGIEISTSPASPRYRVRADREVILSAGAICSPKLLLLSGVGPASALQKLDIPIVRDLPAGQYLSDHIGSGSLRYRAKAGVTWDHLRNTLPGALAFLKWYVLGTGPFSTLCVPSAAFIRSDDSNLPLLSKSSQGLPIKDMSSGPGVPDTEILWAPATVVGPGLEDPPAGSVGMTMLAINLRPESTGTIALKSKDPWVDPIVDPNYFASESDLNVVARAVRFTQRLARTEPLASLLDLRPELNDRSKNIYWIGDVDPDKVTDDELKEFIRDNALPEYHPTSSARMGVDQTTSVVDTELRVHGVHGLRVVDASVFPTQVTGHPVALIVAIAERAADLINKNRQS